MSLTIVTPPPALPISIEEAISHSRILVSTEAGQLAQWIKAATDAVETYTQRRLITQTYDWRMDSFCDHVLRIPWAPVQTVDAIEYVDTGGATQTLASYQLDIYSDPSRLEPAYGTTWPSTREVLNAVRVRFTVGYGANGTYVPKPIRAALLMMVDDLYEHRSAQVESAGGAGAGEYKPNRTVEALLFPYRVPNGAW